MSMQPAPYSHDLFLALTRPPMIKGVAMEAFFINLIVAMCALMLTKNPFMLGIWVPLHLIAMLLCRMDNHIFSILLCDSRLVKAGNRRLWNGVSYEPF